ncbi:MAG: hypothetical protein IJB53_00020, partial [Mailhella sp.]|nr:hypothetical protein [Mailhella sp.]
GGSPLPPSARFTQCSTVKKNVKKLFSQKGKKNHARGRFFPGTRPFSLQNACFSAFEHEAAH